MADNNDYIQDLLALMGSPLYKKQQCKRVPGSQGYRTTENVTDETSIGQDHETTTRTVVDQVILDCGHLGSELAGRTHCCDSVICAGCLKDAECAACGFKFCPSHRVSVKEDGGEITYCRECYEELRRRRRLKTIGEGVISFFIKTEDHHEERG